MDLLHIFKTKPDATTELFVKNLSEDKKTTVINLFEKDTDWDAVIETIFSHKKTVTWW